MQIHLNDEARFFAVKELLADYEDENLYLSPKLASGKMLNYFEGLVQALFYGNDSTFVQYLIEQNCLTAEALKQSNAAEVLAYNEFKRYCIRGTCLQSIKGSNLLRVYRARESKNPSKYSNQRIGDIITPEKMLAIAKIRPNTKTGEEKGIEYEILRPNSGLCVEIYDTGNTLEKGEQANG